MKGVGKIAVIFFLSLAACSLAQAQTYTLGVSPGDSFSYNFYAFWSSTDPEATVPQDVLEMNQTALIKITVHQATGVMVIMNVTRQFLNRTETSTQIWVNLLNGEGEGFGLIIQPNLEKNSLVYPLGRNSSNSFVIDEEMVKNYPFGTRKVLYHAENKTGLGDYRYIYYEMYFDKETGVMLEWYVEQVSRSAPKDKTAVLWRILDFNVKEGEVVPSDGQSEEQPINGWSTALAALLVIVSVAAFLIYRKKRGVRRRSG